MNIVGVQRRPISARNTKWAAAIAASLAKNGVKPNHISVLSVLFAGLAGGCLFLSSHSLINRSVLFLLAALFIQCRLLCNLFDGMVAIEGGFKTKSGAIYNDFPDRIADPLILVPTGYAIIGFESGILFGWLAGLLSVMTAYVRFLGVASGATESFIGPMAKQHRMAIITVALVGAMIAVKWGYQDNFLFCALVLVCAGCVITIARRTARIIRELESA